MQNSPNFSPSSNPTVAKLLEVEADLAAQEVELTAHLVSIQEKRHSLKTVIDMFAPGDVATTESVVTPAQTPVTTAEVQSAEVETKFTPQNVEIPELDEGKTDTPAEVEVSATPSKRQTKKNLPPASSKPSQEADTWQQYVKDEFSNASLAEAVAEVMQQHSEQVLEITIILDTIFAQEMPQELRSKARERVSNVLSVGVKKGKWYRGQAGRYSISKAAVVDDLIT